MPDGTLVDERSGSSRYWYVFGNDTPGTVQGVVDANGDWQAKKDFGSYGEQLASSGSAPNPFWFDGGYQSAAGLYHYGQRFYDPATGRWTQQDPLRQYADLQQDRSELLPRARSLRSAGRASGVELLADWFLL